MHDYPRIFKVKNFTRKCTILTDMLEPNIILQILFTTMIKIVVKCVFCCTDLHLLGELGSLDLDEGGGDCAHVSAAVVEGHTSRPHWVLVLVRVDTLTRESKKLRRFYGT